MRRKEKMKKLPYEKPELVDLSLEKSHGDPACSIGSGDASCTEGSSAGYCSTGTSGGK